VSVVDELVHKYESLIDGAVLLRAQQFITKSEIVAVIHKLRTQLLQDAPQHQKRMKLPEGVLRRGSKDASGHRNNREGRQLQLLRTRPISHKVTSRRSASRYRRPIGSHCKLPGKVGIPKINATNSTTTMGKGKDRWETVRRVGSAATQERF